MRTRASRGPRQRLRQRRGQLRGQRRSETSEESGGVDEEDAMVAGEQAHPPALLTESLVRRADLENSEESD